MAARVARDGPLNERDAVGWAIRLAKRVERLHQLGVAHGGISADVVLTDGPACSSKGMLGDVREAAIRPAYHSPERHSGQGISIADDAWAVAVTLYFLLTGQLPFTGQTTQEIRERIMSVAPAPLAVFDVGDDDLQRVLDKFMSRDESRGSRVTRLRTLLEAWHPEPTARDLPPLDELDDVGDIDEDDDDEEEIQTVMRDFSDVRAQIEQMKQEAAAASAPPPPQASGAAPAEAKPRPFAPIGGVESPKRTPHKVPPPPPETPPGEQPAAAVAGLQRQKATALGGFEAASRAALAAREAARTEPDDDKPTTSMGLGQVRQEALAQAARHDTPPTAVAAQRPPGPPPNAAAPPGPPPPRGNAPNNMPPAPAPQQAAPAVGAAAGGPLQPPQFDIQDNDSEDDVATVMMDAQGGDLSAAIQMALANKAASPSSPMAAPAAAPGQPPAGMAAVAAAQPQRAMVPNGESLDHLIVGEPEDSGMKRALVVAAILLVIVVAAVVLLWMGQEGML